MALKRRERVLLLFVFIAIAIWAFDRFYYTPQGRTIAGLKQEIKAAELKWNESLLLTKGVESVEAEVSRMEKELRGSRGRALSRDGFETFLRHLARESSRLQMKMISMIPQEEKVASQGEEKDPSPSPYKKVHIQLVLHSGFNSLGTYLKAIEELPFSVTLSDLQVERDERIFPLLKVTLGLTVYLLTT